MSIGAQKGLWEPVTETDVEEDYVRGLDNNENPGEKARVRLGQKNEPPNYTATLVDPKNGPITFDLQKPGSVRQVQIKDNNTSKLINPQRLQWNSSCPNVAEVDATGLVTAREAGITIITATDPTGIIYAIEVTVQGPIENPRLRSRLAPVESLELNQAVTLSVVGIEPPSLKHRKIKWISSNPRIAEVITAVKIRDNKLVSGVTAPGQAAAGAPGQGKSAGAPDLGKTPPAPGNGQQGKPGEATTPKLNPAGGEDATAPKPSPLYGQPPPNSIPDDPNKCLVRALYPGTVLIMAVEDQDDGKDEISNVDNSPEKPRVVYAAVVRVKQPETNPLPPSVFVADNKLRYLRHRFRYRPYTYEMMVNTVDNREMRSSRFKSFQALSLLGTVASIVSPLIRSSDKTASDAIGAYNGALLPALQKLYPSMTESQRQNVVSMTMKSIEEIPFGADINRVLFFPKHQFRGLLPGYWTRIGEIDTSYFNITVAVVSKNNQTTENAATTTLQR